MIISEMQSKLATWSSTDKERKFDRLLRMVADRSWLQEAARVTLASSGARTAGIDGIDKQAMERELQYQLDDDPFRVCWQVSISHSQQGECISRKPMASSGHWVFQPFGIGLYNVPC